MKLPDCKNSNFCRKKRTDVYQQRDRGKERGGFEAEGRKERKDVRSLNIFKV